MKKSSNSLSSLHWTLVIAGFLVTVLCGSYFFDISAQTQVTNNPDEQNLVLGKLLFNRTAFSSGGITGGIETVNSDGTGRTGIATNSLLPTYATWAPDGTKVLYISNADIFTVSLTGGDNINLTNTTEFEADGTWSVSGKIAYERNSRIWTMNADGSGQAQFSSISQNSSSDPEYSPDGTKLAFVSAGEIWVINADGSNERRVTTNSTTDADPAWSPDGTKIIFGRGSGISVINLDGTNETPLTGGAGVDIQPSWSNDGTKIAFRRTNATNLGIYTMNEDGSNQLRVVADSPGTFPSPSTIYENPKWQPVAQIPNTFTISGRLTHNTSPVIGATVNLNGTTKASVTTDATGNYQFSGLTASGNYNISPSFPKHYFTPANRSFNNLNSNQLANFEVLGICQFGNCVKNGKIAFTRSSDIFTINPDGTNQTNITNNAAGNSEPDYSPDGSNIIFTTNRDGNYEIYRMNADGSNPVRLTSDAAQDNSPQYSPDGTSIVFVSVRDGNAEIYRMNADGTNQIRLTSEATQDTSPIFSPDAQKIFFVSTRLGLNRQRLFSMNFDGSNPQVFDTFESFSPRYESLSFSPDRSKMMFNYTPDSSTQIATTWTINADGTNRMRFPADGSYGTYSPDGIMVAYTCCIFDNTNRLRTSNAIGTSSSVQTLTPSNTGNFSPDWQSIRAPRPTTFDFDGDERADVSVFRPSNSVWYQHNSTTGFASVQWGATNDVIVPADYDGDLKTDIAVWRPSEGYFYILNSFDNTVRAEDFGLAGDIPVGGDWDGDGKADPAVYRGGSSQSYFYYRGSMGNPQGIINFVPWGIAGDKPIARDYDGDGLTDAAVYRNGNWFVRKSSDGQFSATNFGLANDVLVPADYDGDGKTDVAVYRNGIWYLLRSAQGFAALQFGIAADIPAPADYDGDGKADVAVYRNGTWWMLKSQAGTAEAVSFGINEDKPISSAFVR